jgi:ribulose-phosphate 3-epimerase
VPVLRGRWAAPYPAGESGERRITRSLPHGGAVLPPRLGAMPVQMAPSILSADFARLADEAAAVTGAADWLHVDVMDYHFVPNLTLGLPVVEALLKHAGLPLDCHLMIEDPDRWAPGYAEAGARNVTIHAEAATSPVRTLRMIRAAGARAGLALNPATPVEPYEDLLPEFDMLLLMTVEPGFGGQQYLAGMEPKIAAARTEIDRHGLEVELEVDGGIDGATIGAAARAGATVFCAGSALFNGPGTMADRVAALREAAAAGMEPTKSIGWRSPHDGSSREGSS